MTARVKSILFLFFLISGFCGLLYQVVWLRIAFASFGVVTPVLSVVISIFMSGLFAGSWCAGRWAERITKRLKIQAIYLYGVAELLIGCGAWAVPQLFAAGETYLLPVGQSDSSAYLISSALVIAGAIFPWCFFMGATFPLMTAFVKEQEQTNETSFSFLYLGNVIGAMVGTLVTAVLLIELLGFRNTLWVGAACNLLIGLGAIAVGLAHSRIAPAESQSAPTSARSASMWTSSPLVALILFGTGFTSMAMEVVWTRAFTVVLKTQVYSFAMLLFVYLLATWIGSLFYRRDLGRRCVMATAKLIAMLALAALLPLVMNDPRGRFSWYGALASIFPFCALLGYLTPKLIDEYSQGCADRVGSSYAVNTVGCILGPLAASYLLLPTFRLKYVFLILAAPYAVLMIYFAVTRALAAARWRFCGVAAVATFLISIFWIGTYEDRRYDADPERTIIRRDHTATVVSFGKGMDKSLLVNGIGLTRLDTVTKLMAHLPLAHLQEQPTSALIICFGMGTTWRSALSWNIETTAVELVPSVRDAFPFYFDDASTLLARPNGKIVVDDGRRFLHRTSERFDLITLDPPPPVEAAGSSLLYSDEFYEAAKLRLKPNGILQQWCPLNKGDTVRAVARSLLRSFPHVRMFTGYAGFGAHFLASMGPLERLKSEQLVAKMPPAAQADLVEWCQDKDPLGLLRLVLSKEIDLGPFVGDGLDRITDDRPFNEYFLVRRFRRRWFEQQSPLEATAWEPVKSRAGVLGGKDTSAAKE
jgi:spermidine synthase